MLASYVRLSGLAYHPDRFCTWHEVSHQTCLGPLRNRYETVWTDQDQRLAHRERSDVPTLFENLLNASRDRLCRMSDGSCPKKCVGECHSRPSPLARGKEYVWGGATADHRRGADASEIWGCCGRSPIWARKRTKTLPSAGRQCGMCLKHPQLPHLTQNSSSAPATATGVRRWVGY